MAQSYFGLIRCLGSVVIRWEHESLCACGPRAPAGGCAADKKEVEDALANEGPLALLHQFKAGDVPYIKADFVSRRIQEHQGMTQKISEVGFAGVGASWPYVV